MATSNSKDFAYFLENYNEIYNMYGHKFIVLKNERILGAYDSIHHALIETTKTEQAGTFIVQECSGNSSAYTASFLNLCIS